MNRKAALKFVKNTQLVELASQPDNFCSFCLLDYHIKTIDQISKVNQQKKADIAKQLNDKVLLKCKT